MPNLSISQVFQAYEGEPSGNPGLKLMDWTRRVTAQAIRGASSQTLLLSAGDSVTAFNGQQALSTDGTTDFDIVVGNGYIDLEWSAGTNPVFRTQRAFNANTLTFDLVVLPNRTATLTTAGNFVAGGVQVDDIVWIRDLNVQPFSAINQGQWKVLAVTTTQLSLARMDDVFSGQTQLAVAVTASDQLIVFSSAGVQRNSTVVLSSAFGVAAGPYIVDDANPSYLRLLTTQVLPGLVGVLPGATGVIAYTNAKKFLYIESSQSASVTLNGTVLSLTPLQPGEPFAPAMFMVSGPVWSLALENTSSADARITLLMAE